MPVFAGFDQFTENLKERCITYGVIDGLAVFAYGGERTTFDIDLLIHGKD